MKLYEILDQKVNSIKYDIIQTITNVINSRGVKELMVRTTIKGDDFRDDIFIICVDVENYSVVINSKIYHLSDLSIEHLVILLSSIENQ